MPITRRTTSSLSLMVLTLCALPALAHAVPTRQEKEAFSETTVPPSIVKLDDEDEVKMPPKREELEKAVPKSPILIKAVQPDENGEDGGLPFHLRENAIREAAMSYGARGGLAMETFLIRQQMESHAKLMDKVYDFRQLLIAAPSGLLIEPPVISENDNALIINEGGQEAAVSDRIYNINKKAKIVSAARLWRNYLEREWGEVTPPADILFPQTKAERVLWIKSVREGWEKGFDQADEIYQDDLNQLTADFQGMVRYRMLLAEGMVSAPYALQVDRGITGGGDEMRVGDRAVQITGVPELQPVSDQWQPANR